MNTRILHYGDTIVAVTPYATGRGEFFDVVFSTPSSSDYCVVDSFGIVVDGLPFSVWALIARTLDVKAFPGACSLCGCKPALAEHILCAGCF